MTSSGLVQQLVPKPFAHNGTITEIVVGTSTTTPSFDDGFPEAFSSPRSGGGEYILRGMMNAVGNLASANEYFRQGGGLYQFNPEWARLNGGYARGAVLDYLDGNKLYKVISLVDNNKVDYTKSVLTAAQISAGIITGGIDGINWMYCNVEQTVKYNEICDVPDFKWYGEIGDYGTEIDVFQIGYFLAPRNGMLNIIGSCDFTSSKVEISQGTEIAGGFAIAVCSKKVNGRIVSPAYSTADPESKYIYCRGYFLYNGVGLRPSIDNEDIMTMNVVGGTEYAIFIVNNGGNVSSSTMKIVLS